MHRRGIIRLLTAVLVAVVISSFASRSTTPATEPEIIIPDDHRVLSLPIDERVPPVTSGDLVDLYLTIDGFAGVDGVVETLDEPAQVISVGDGSFSIAVIDHDVAAVAEALNSGGVLVVRR